MATIPPAVESTNVAGTPAFDVRDGTPPKAAAPKSALSALSSMPGDNVFDAFDNVDISDIGAEDPFVPAKAAAVVTRTIAATQTPAAPEAAPEATPALNASKELLDVKGFYIGAGAGLYEGAQREGEEPRESFYVDIQRYDGGVQRIWGVHLQEVMSLAKDKQSLQAGDRIRLLQQPKREFARSVVENGEMRNIKSYANWWAWERDQSPLPPDLKHLMAEINVEGELEKIALRHGLTTSDVRYAEWHRDQQSVLKALGDDPKLVKDWIHRQKTMSPEDETRMLTKASQQVSYLTNDDQRAAWLLQKRTELKSMSVDNRYDFLMRLANPSLLHAQSQSNTQLHAEVSAAIANVVDMMSPLGASHDAPSREGLTRVLEAKIAGLTAGQSIAYLHAEHRRIFDRQAAEFAQSSSANANEQTMPAPIMLSPGANSKAYETALYERLSKAHSHEEKMAVLNCERIAIESKQQLDEADLENISALHRRIAAERDVDATAYWIDRGVESLVNAFNTTITNPLKQVFNNMRVGAWRRDKALDAMDDLHHALDDARETKEYKAFVNDPRVVEEARNRKLSIDDCVSDPNFANSLIAAEHKRRMAGHDDELDVAPRDAGIYSKTVSAAKNLLDSVTKMGPVHLLRDGKIDSEWMTKMQNGLTTFGAKLEKTLMVDDIAESIRVTLKAVMDAIRNLMKLLMERVRPLDNAKQVEATAASTHTPEFT